MIDFGRSFMTQSLDWDAAAEFTRDVMVIVDGISDEDHRPSWNPGDFFAAFNPVRALRAKKQSARPGI